MSYSPVKVQRGTAQQHTRCRTMADSGLHPSHAGAMYNNTPIATAMGVAVTPFADPCMTEGMIALHDNCVDKPTPDNYTCTQQRTFNKCYLPFMTSALAAQWQVRALCSASLKECIGADSPCPPLPSLSPASGMRHSLQVLHVSQFENRLLSQDRAVMNTPAVPRLAHGSCCCTPADTAGDCLSFPALRLLSLVHGVPCTWWLLLHTCYTPADTTSCLLYRVASASEPASVAAAPQTVASLAPRCVREQGEPKAQLQQERM